MTRQERSDLRRRLREGREHLRLRLREELGRVDFKALRAQARAAKAKAARESSRDGQQNSAPTLSTEQVQEAQRRLTELKGET